MAALFAFPLRIGTRSHQYELDYVNNNSTVLVVSFNHLGSTTLKDAGFDTSFLVSTGFDVIYCKTSRNDWYQGLSASLLEGAIKSTNKIYERMYFYGSSMGGYAAIYYATQIGNAEAIAISPQYTPKTSKTAFEARWRAEWDQFDLLHSELSTKTSRDQIQIDLFLDPHDVGDSKHSALIREVFSTAVRLYEFPSSGHPAGPALNRANLYRPVIEHILGISAALPDLYVKWQEFIEVDCGTRTNQITQAANLGPGALLSKSFEYLEEFVSLDSEGLIGIASHLAWKNCGNLQRAFCHAAASGQTLNPHIYAFAAVVLGRDGHNIRAHECIEAALSLEPGNADFIDAQLKLSWEDGPRSYGIVAMQKDEGKLLLQWALYHIQVCGAENIVLLDNGSTDKLTLSILDLLTKMGVNIEKRYFTRTDFENKGQLLIESGRRLLGETTNVFPIDIDEFLFSFEGEPCFEPNVVHTALIRVQDGISSFNPLLRISIGRLNVPGKLATTHWHPKRLLVGSTYVGPMDVGMHLYDWDREADEFAHPIPEIRNIGILHCHNRSFDDIVIRAKVKLSSRVESFEPEYLTNYRGAGRHLVKYLLIEESEYYDEFDRMDQQSIAETWSKCGVPLPFTDATKPLLKAQERDG